MTSEELGQLYASHGYLVHRRCQAILGNQQDADDALQEVFLRVGRYPPVQVESILGWLYGIAQRVCFDLLARRRRIEPRADQVLTSMIDAVRFDDRTNRIASLHYLDGFTQEEVAQRTGYSRRTVGKKLKALEARFRSEND